MNDIELTLTNLVKWCEKTGMSFEYIPGDKHVGAYHPYCYPTIKINWKGRYYQVVGYDTEHMLEHLKHSHKHIFIELQCPPFEE